MSHSFLNSRYFCAQCNNYSVCDSTLDQYGIDLYICLLISLVWWVFCSPLPKITLEARSIMCVYICNTLRPLSRLWTLFFSLRPKQKNLMFVCFFSIGKKVHRSLSSKMEFDAEKQLGNQIGSFWHRWRLLPYIFFLYMLKDSTECPCHKVCAARVYDRFRIE